MARRVLVQSPYLNQYWLDISVVAVTNINETWSQFVMVSLCLLWWASVMAIISCNPCWSSPYWFFPLSPERELHVYGRYLDPSSIMLEAYHETTGTHVQDSQMSLRLTDSNVLNARAFIRPQIVDDVMVRLLLQIIMTSWHGNAFRITDLLWGNPSVTGGFPHKGPLVSKFDVLFVASLNKLF